MKVQVYGINYDTDGESQKDLPETLYLYIDTNDLEIAEHLISDAISDKTGFCHFGFCFKVLEEE